MNSDIEINHQWSLFTPLGAKRDGTKRTQALFFYSITLPITLKKGQVLPNAINI
jgi:hypothetical protein